MQVSDTSLTLRVSDTGMRWCVLISCFSNWQIILQAEDQSRAEYLGGSTVFLRIMNPDTNFEMNILTL